MEQHLGRVDTGEVELSVIIPTHNRSSILCTTLQRLGASALPCRWEVVVVANACTDDTAALVREVAAGRVPVRLIEDARPSASIARNRGAHDAAGSLLVFLDDDILLEPWSLTTIWNWYNNSDQRSLLVGQVRPLAEHLATPFGAFRQEAQGGHISRHRQPEGVDWYASGVAAVPAATFNALGGYSEDYPAAGLEDADFAIRARRAGNTIIFHPAVVGNHNDWAGTTAIDYCRRAARYASTAPLLVNRFPDNQHPWARLVEVNRPTLTSDPLRERTRKRLKAAGVLIAADRWLPAFADRTRLPRRPRELIYRASVSLAMYGGYQRGLQGSVQRQPLEHRIAWRVAESGVRGNSYITRWLRGRVAPATGLVRLPNGHVLHHDPTDYVARDIYSGGYEPAERWVFQHFIRPGGLVVDVGANVGIYTLTASRLVGPSGRVLAFEPGPALPRLRPAVEAAHCKNVTIVPFALGAAYGEAVMHVPAHQAGLASLRNSCDKTDADVVAVRRLDAVEELPAGEIDLLKIDTEGYEHEVLAGSSGLLEARRVRCILMEVSPGFGDVRFVGETASAYGFDILKVGYRKGLRHRPTLRRATVQEVEAAASQANYLLLRSDLAEDPLLQQDERLRSCLSIQHLRRRHGLVRLARIFQ